MDLNEKLVQDTAEFTDELNDEALDRSAGFYASMCVCLTREPED